MIGDLFKMVFSLLFLLFTSLTVNSHDKVQDFEELYMEKVRSDLVEIKAHQDSAFYYINTTYNILKDEVKIFGVWKTIQINFGIFKPYLIFIGMYLLWLIKRK